MSEPKWNQPPKPAAQPNNTVVVPLEQAIANPTLVFNVNKGTPLPPAGKTLENK